MKNVKFYLKIFILILIVFYKVCDYEFENRGEIYTLNESNRYIETDFIKDDKLDLYNEKIKKLIYLKYPKYVSDELVKDSVLKKYELGENELIIYFSNYYLKPKVDELLYLRVNYNEIKDYINFNVTTLDNYENESGYNYTNSKKSIAITFDDSPNLGKTNKIIKYLSEFHFHATFFVLGEKCIDNEDLLISIKNSGNEIGTHSYAHKNLNRLTNDEILSDYQKVNNIYKRLFNEDIKLMRPPYGLYKDYHLNLLNMPFILWNVDTMDWKYKNSDYLVKYVLNNIKDGDIILFHDLYDSTVLTIKKLLPELYSRGYQVMSVSELAKIKGKSILNKEVYFSFN